jgi:hypothetical protein
MFLLWQSYRDKAGRTRFYARLVESRREGRRVRHLSVGSLRVSLQQGTLSDRDRRYAWRHLDYVLERCRPSPTERANIERTFASKIGERPPPTPVQHFAEALLKARGD